MTTDTTESWSDPFDTLRGKWTEVPCTRTGYQQTETLLELPDELLMAVWETARADITTGDQFAHRGWYHTLYAPGMRDKKVIDIGSGFGVDSLTFAQHGAKLTFIDIAESNLAVLKRLAGIMGVEANFVWLSDLDVLKSLDHDYDVIMAMGSLHHAPQSVIQPEVHELLKHLKIGGRWLQLAYPESRWVREGRPDFSEWGLITDGAGTPWAEWYDLDKLLAMMSPATFDVVLYQEFNDSEFNWFDLRYLGQPGDQPPARYEVPEALRDTVARLTDARTERIRDQMHEHQGKRLICYGGGKDFVQLLEKGMFSGLELLGVLDDGREPGTSVGGQPVLSPDDLPTLQPDVILVTSSSYEDKLKRTRSSTWPSTGWTRLSCELIRMPHTRRMNRWSESG